MMDKEMGNANLNRSFNETVKTPFTQRIIEFASPEYKMPTNIRLYDGTTYLEDHLSRFASATNLGEWPMPVWCVPANIGWKCTRFSTWRACFKDHTEITKVVRKANETLVAFLKRWTVKTGFIFGVLEILKISSFIDENKCLELAKRYSDKVEMGEISEASKKALGPLNRGMIDFIKGDTELTNKRTKGCDPIRLNLKSFTKHPKEILATKLQLNLPQETDRSGFRIRKTQPLDKRRKAERTGEGEGKEDVKDKVINMIRAWSEKKKRKSMEEEEDWMNVPIVFPPISSEDISDEPIIMEADVEGYLVRRVYVDQRSSLEITTLVEHIIVAGAENRPPMLEKIMYDSWASHIHLFIKGKKHGRMMLDSIDNGLLVYPTVEENRQTRLKKYSKLTEAQQLQDDC
ncbi:hypothetical protein Tco_1000450 [Tanacetum coccineum]